jgi:mRNA interferase RelE/StbE
VSGPSPAQEVEWTKPAAHDLKRLDPEQASRIRAAVARLAATGQGDVRRLQGRDREWRLRVGSWRVRFRYAAKTIIVLRVLPRGKAYQ